MKRLFVLLMVMCVVFPAVSFAEELSEEMSQLKREKEPRTVRLDTNWLEYRAKLGLAIGYPWGITFGYHFSKTFEANVTAGTWEHDGNPVMTWCVNNAVVARDAADNIKPDKKHSTERIDGVPATINALARASLGGGAAESVYETRGMAIT